MADEAFQFTPEMLDDFFAECDEQLTNVRAQIATLEAGDSPGASAPALASAFRSLHSLKGNAAIVGLAAAEQLAHAAESLLRPLTRNELAPSPTIIDVLARTAHRLDEIVARFRLEQPVPAVADLLAELSAIQTTGTLATSAAPDSPPPRGAPSTWRASFTPSRDLDRRGVNVNSVRARLASLGRIVSAIPAVQPGGAIRIDFTVELTAAPQHLADWERDHVTWSPVADPSAGPTETPATAPARAPDPVAAATLGDRSNEAPASLFTAPSHIVRVDLGRLDDLMRITGELVIQRSRLQDQIARLGGHQPGLQEVSAALTRSLRDLREAVMRVRLVPVAEVFARLPLVVRDLSRDAGRKVRLVVQGEDTAVDKYVVERLKESLLHLVRNAVVHGIETAEQRRVAGKPEEGTLQLRAQPAGGCIVIEVEDDGGGLDAARILERAAAAGLPVPAEADAQALLRLICAPGFSTREEADLGAGRGVGMSVVETTVRELGGTLSMATESGRFTRFTLRLPLTLSIADAFLVSAGPQTCAVPQTDVEEIIEVPAAAMRSINRREVAPYRDGLLPVSRLRSIFGAPASEQSSLPVLVLHGERGVHGLVVDRVHGHREVVVRPVQDPLLRVPGVAGATELGDGRPVLILDAATLPGAAAARATTPRLPALAS